MDITEQDIRSIVEKVVSTINVKPAGDLVPPEVPEDQPGVFRAMEKAVLAAEKAHKDLMGMTLEKRKEIIAGVRKKLLENLEQMSKMAVEETTFGRWEDKVLKNRLAVEKTPGVEDHSLRGRRTASSVRLHLVPTRLNPL